jgi:hypothetical protein
MRRALVLASLALALAAAVVVGGGDEDSSPVKSSGVTKLVSLAASGVEVDYTPLASPKEAVGEADLVVEGTVTDIVEGIGLQFADPLYTERSADTYATFVVTVTRVISGDASKVQDGKVYVEILKSRATPISALAGANTQPNAVLVLDDITAWQPSSDAKVTRPAAVPSSAPLYAPYTDGLWLQGPSDAEMLGLHVGRDELPSPWGQPRTTSDVAAALTQAAP